MYVGPYPSFQTRFNTGCTNYERSVIGFRGSLYELHADGGNLVCIHEFHENTNLAAAENRENISTTIVVLPGTRSLSEKFLKY
jgi:hypothetical protein